MGRILVYDKAGNVLPFEHLEVSDAESARCYLDQWGDQLPFGWHSLEWVDGDVIVPLNYTRQNRYLLNETNANWT